MGMNLHFKSLRSSSSGNCLMLWSDTTRILIDCGIRTQWECREALDGHAGQLDGVVISHAHGDHICYSALRVLERYGTPIHCHEDVVGQIHYKHVRQSDTPPRLDCFSSEPYVIGDFQVCGVRLPHEPAYPTFGFVIRCGTGGDARKIVICTDFNDYGGIVGYLADADFVFVEANHDPELLRLRWNPASLFHLSNPKTAELLCQAKTNGGFSPQQVMLGHLSNQRNTEDLARETIRQGFEQAGIEIDFRLEIAPRYEESLAIRIE